MGQGQVRLSWQVGPIPVIDIFTDGDRDRANPAMHAVLGMGKIDIAAVLAAAGPP